MKNSLNLFFKDIKNITTNFSTAVIIVGLIFLPSLYAWLNIKASWDPYGQTDQLPIGIVNEDTGEVVRDEEIDVGRELVDELKENDSLDWKFMDRNEARDQLEKGDLFAYIVIPEDFSKKLGTVVEAEPEKANVEYYVNEKINAIAPKITEKGASVIVDDVSRNFISTVNGIIFDIFNEIGIELEAELPDIERFEQYIFDIEEKLPDIYETLEESLDDAKKAQTTIQKIEKELPNVENVAETGLEIINHVNKVLDQAEKQFHEMSPKIKEELEQAKESSASVQSFMEELETPDNIDLDELEEKVTTVEEKMDDSLIYLDALIETLEDLSQDGNEEYTEKLEETIEDIEHIQSIIYEGKDHAEEFTNLIEEHEGKLAEVFEQIEQTTVKVDDHITDFLTYYDEEIEPTVFQGVEKTRKTINDAKDILVGIQNIVPEVEEILNNTDEHLRDGEQLLTDVLDEYPYVHDKISELADRVRNIQEEADIHEIIDLLQNDPDAEKGFFAEPVTLSENKVFPVENYGSGMTPFYTVLALWVGGLLLISLLTTDVFKPEAFHFREIYFGKWLTFVCIGLFQALIVTLGDLFIINVEIAHPVWFVLFGLFCSFVFMTLIYTFVSIFGDVGKAIAIIMLVLQIAGSGGTYPVVLLPRFFQLISPFLPFTYAVNLMREALGGIVWSNALTSIFMLTLFMAIAITVGAFLKGPINRLMQKIIGDSKDTSVFH